VGSDVSTPDQQRGNHAPETEIGQRSVDRGQDCILDRGRPGRPAAWGRLAGRRRVNTLKAWAQAIAITIAILAAVGGCVWLTLASLAGIPV
jgi:hypothetical protein